jgi:hypothetical protein
MALNPNISLQTQGIKVPDFAGAYESILNNRARREGMEQNRQLHAAQMDEYKRKTAAGEEAARRQAATLQKLAGGAKPDDIMGDDPELALKLKEDQRKDYLFKLDEEFKKLSNEKVQFDNNVKKFEFAAQNLNTIKDESTFLAAVSNLRANDAASREDVAPYLAEYAKKGWSPELLQQIQVKVQGAKTLKDQIAEKQQEFDNNFKTLEEKRKALAFPLEQTKLANEAITTCLLYTSDAADDM